MTIEEFIKILNDVSMLKKQTNIKILEKKTGGGSGKPRKPPKYFTDFKNQMLDFVKEQRSFNTQMLAFVQEQRKVNAQNEKNWKEQRKFNQLIIKRFDNLVKKNDLKE